MPNNNAKTKKVQPMAFNGGDGGVNTLKLDTRIIPIYPVRYAYANFFEKELSAASDPPALPTLLQAKSIAEGKGYVVRLLRVGWIYLREEDDAAKGQFHIFKYERVEQNGRVIERFPKYTFKNKINAQDGLVQDKSGARPDGYPFVFVRKGVKQISIVYSEHEWSPDVIDNMHGRESERKAAMQRVDLEAETDAHAVKATAENFKKLIEDYRSRKDRLLKLKESDQNPALKGLSLDVLTTEVSYEMNGEDIASELQIKAAYGETARIVALFDPVGRQREIAEAHAKLNIWEKDVASLNMYPFVIGQFIDQLKHNPNEDIKEAVKKSINLSEHSQYWQEMNQEFGEFKQRQEQFAQLYKAFMFGSGSVGKVGSLDTYFKKFFCRTPSGNEALETEFQKLCHLSAAIFAGMLASTPAKKAMEEVISNAAEQGDLEQSTNAVHACFEFFRGYVTTPHSGFDWSITSVKALDKLLQMIGPIWGEAVASFKFGANLAKRAFNKLSFNSLSYIAKNLVPGTLKVFGLKIDANNRVRLTDDELARVIAKIIEEGVKKATGGVQKGVTAIDKAELKMQRGQKLFDWAERIRAKKLPQLWDLSEVQVIRTSGKRYSFVVPENRIQRIGLIFDTSFAGLSAFFNILTISDIAAQTRFSKADPLQRGSQMHSMIRFTSAIASLTLDLALIARSGALITGKVLAKATPLANAIAPAIRGSAKHLGRFLASKLATRLIAVANFAGCVSSLWDGVKAYKLGNTGEAIGHTFIAISSGILFAQAVYAIGVVGEATAATVSVFGVTIPVAVIIAAISLLLIGIGMMLIYLFKKSDFQVLLENCFWGNGGKYAFWYDEKERPQILRRLDRARDIHQNIKIMTFYRMEFQEFMNFLCMPKLELDRDVPFAAQFRGLPRTYTFKFKLPNFQPGISDVEFGLYTITEMEPNGQLKTTPNKKLSKELSDKMKHAKIEYTRGPAIIKVSMELPERANIIWAYLPQPGVIVPMRILTEDGLRQQLVAGMYNGNPI